MKKKKNGKFIRGLIPQYDDKKNLIGYITRSVWGSVTYYDTDLNKLDETKRSFIRFGPRE